MRISLILLAATTMSFGATAFASQLIQVNSINQLRSLDSPMASQPVSTQITDSVTQSNVKVVGEAPGMAMSNLYASAEKNLFVDSPVVYCGQGSSGQTSVLDFDVITLNGDIRINCQDMSLKAENIVSQGGVIKVGSQNAFVSILVRNAIPETFRNTVKFCKQPGGNHSHVHITSQHGENDLFLSEQNAQLIDCAD